MKNLPTDEDTPDRGIVQEDVGVRRANPIEIICKQRLFMNGKLRFLDTDLPGFIHASPLLDVSENIELVRETIEA